MDKLIGNTPLIKIKYKYKNQIKEIYAKLEYYNLTGSIKDRMAYYIVKKEYENGNLKKGMPIIEATSGNTGISFSAIGAYFENPVYIFMPDWVSSERKSIMEMFGAHVTLVSKEQGGFRKCIELANELSNNLNGFRPNQFDNMDNIEAHYLTTGKEIVEKLDNISGFVSGIGTGGTLMGISKRLKESNPNMTTCALEPDDMPLFSSGKIFGSHKIDGIGDDFIPSIVNQNTIDTVITVDDDDAINMARMLGEKLGLGVGISSGANLLGSVLLKEKIGGNIVTVFPDCNKKYLSTDLSKKLDLNKDFISNKIQLISYEVI